VEDFANKNEDLSDEEEEEKDDKFPRIA